MRELKFRLLNEHNEIVGYEKWFIGEFNKETKKDYYVNLPKYLYSKDNDKYEKKYIEHRYKEKYIGLKDKNDKEIYEGDICMNNIKKTLFEVKYGLYDIESRDGWIDSSHLGFYLYRIDEPELDTFTNVSNIILEIIGNIHQNQELLESK